MTEIIQKIHNKICPSEQDEALLTLMKRVNWLEAENAELREQVQQLMWVLEEKD